MFGKPDTELSDEMSMRITTYLYQRHPEIRHKSPEDVIKFFTGEGREDILRTFLGLAMYCTKEGIDVNDLERKPISELYGILDTVFKDTDSKESIHNNPYNFLMDSSVKVDNILLTKGLITITYNIPDQIKRRIFRDSNSFYPRDTKLKIEWAPKDGVALEDQKDFKVYSDHDAFIEGLTFKEITDVPNDLIKTLIAKSFTDMFSFVSDHLT